MATVRHLGHFALFNISPDIWSPASGRICPQTASEFNITQLSNGNVFPIWAANIENSPYVPMTFERAILWNWKIKSWNVNFDFEFRYDDEDNTVNASGSFIVESMANNEKDLVCRSGRFEGGYESFQDENDPFQPQDYTIGVEIGNLVSARYVPSINGVSGLNLSQSVRQSGNTYYMPVEININVVGVGFTTVANSGILIPDGGGADQIIEWSINDGVQLYAKPFRFGDDSVLLNGSVDISVNEYWAYA